MFEQERDAEQQAAEQVQPVAEAFRRGNAMLRVPTISGTR